MEASREQQAMELVCRSLLGLTDLLRVAHVCKAWHSMVVNELPRIKVLDLSAHYALRDAAVALALVRRCTGATSINLGYVRLSAEVPFRSFVDAFSVGLRSLDVSSVAAKKTINDEAIDELTQRCRALTRLNVFGCWMLSDMALKHIGERCTALQYLHVGSCMNVTDNGVRCIAQGCPSLLDLNLWRLDQVSDKSLLLVAERCQHLNVLVASDTKFITHAGLKNFSQQTKIYF